VGRCFVQNLNISDLLRACPRLETLVVPKSSQARQWRYSFPISQALSSRNFRLNSETSMFLPPVAVVCARCGAPLFDRLDSYVIGPGTQAHISFEVYTQERPHASVRGVDSPRQLNCDRNCHSVDGLFLIAGRGDFIDTRGFAFAVACGPDLAHLIALEDSMSGVRGATDEVKEKKTSQDELFLPEDRIIKDLTWHDWHDSNITTFLDPLVRRILQQQPNKQLPSLFTSPVKTSFC